MALTDKDMKALRELFEVILDEKEVLTKKDIEHLPTKDEFYEQTSEILKRLDDLEESNTLISERVSKHSDVIEKLRKIHPQYSHN
jgi:hypothetical protein